MLFSPSARMSRVPVVTTPAPVLERCCSFDRCFLAIFYSSTEEQENHRVREIDRYGILCHISAIDPACCHALLSVRSSFMSPSLSFYLSFSPTC